MKKHSFYAVAIATICMAALGSTAARADLLDDVMKAKKIRIATDLAIPPSGMVDGNMKPTGSDVETAQLLAKDWGLELEFVQTTGATRIPNVQTNKADIIISTLSVTPDRAKVIDFTKAYAASAIRRRLPEIRRREELGGSEGQDHRRLPRHDPGYRADQHEGSEPDPRAL